MKESTTKTRLQKAAVIIIWILIWQLGAVLVDQPLYLPTPVNTLKSVLTLIQQKTFYVSVGATILRVCVGLCLSVILGIALGALSAKVKIVGMFLDPIVSIMKPIPIMSVIILLLLWLKGSTVPVAVCIMLCFPIIYTNTLEGVLNVDKKLLEMARIYKIKRGRIFKEIIIPSLKPHIFSSIMVCIGFSWKSVVTAEVLSSPKYSMGYNLYATKLYLNTQELFAWTLVIILFSLLVEKVFKKVFKWAML